jgi:hypothetical protein
MKTKSMYLIHDLTLGRDEYKKLIMQYMVDVVGKSPQKSIQLYSLYDSKKQYNWIMQLIKAGKLVKINSSISLP